MSPVKVTGCKGLKDLSHLSPVRKTGSKGLSIKINNGLLQIKITFRYNFLVVSFEKFTKYSMTDAVVYKIQHDRRSNLQNTAYMTDAVILQNTA